MGNVTAKVLERLARMYGTPKHTNDVDGFFDEFERVLAYYDDDVLEAAVSDVISHRAYPTWPTVGEINAACENRLPAKSSTARPVYRPEPDWPEPSPEAKARVQELVQQAKKNIAMGRIYRSEPDGTLSEISKRMTGEADE